MVFTEQRTALEFSPITDTSTAPTRTRHGVHRAESSTRIPSHHRQTHVQHPPGHAVVFTEQSRTATTVSAVPGKHTVVFNPLQAKPNPTVYDAEVKGTHLQTLVLKGGDGDLTSVSDAGGDGNSERRLGDVFVVEFN